MINNIKLINWKAFDKFDIDFTEGINFVVGPNGIGKTSILHAICVAFTGQIPEEQKGTTFKHLIKDENKDCSIILDFNYEDNAYLIERNFVVNRIQPSKLIINKGKEIISGWHNMTEYILNLFGVKKTFFNLLIYLSEGHVYRSINDSKGKLILEDLDEIIGINKINSLSQIINSAHGEYNVLESDIRSKLNDVSIGLNDVSKQNELEQIYEGQVSKRDEIRDIITKTNYELFDNKNKFEKANDINKIWKTADILRQELKIQEKDYVSNQSSLNDLEKDIFQFNVNLKYYNNRIKEYTNFINIFENSKDDNGNIELCPLCKKPLSDHDKKELTNEYQNEIVFSKSNIKDIEMNINKIKSEIADKKILLKKYSDELNQYDLLIRSISDYPSLNNIEEVAEGFDEKIKEITFNLKELQGSLSELDNAIVKTRANIVAMEKISQVKLESMHSDRNSISKMRYLLDFVKLSTNEFIAEQRNSELRANLYETIAKVWGHFVQSNDWHMNLDSEGAPILIDQEGKEYQYRYLSGGEKTAILVITRTILNKILADNVGFLLIDEPLEHLDSRNRRSLLNFLVDTSNSKLIKQMIITTTEASLLNRYINVQNVNLIFVEELVINN